RHNELRDLKVELLEIVCKDVEIEPQYQDTAGEQLNSGSNMAQDARLDIDARGFWEHNRSAFNFDIRVCHPNAESYRNLEPQQIYRMHENEKKRSYSRRVLDIEHVVSVDWKQHTPFYKIRGRLPSRHVDGKLPILDLKVWMERRRHVGDDGQDRDIQVVLHEFYYKDVASRSVINARSALPWSCKRTILRQEMLRILLNCSRELPWEVIVAHVNHMMLRLQYSAYDQKFRKEVVRSALAAYNRLVELDANGEKPLHRPREWKAHERARERKKRRDNWFRKGGYETVIFVPATPGSQIKRRYMREIKATESKIKVVE
ncbi:hypothetical protein AWC38_SpisGene24796, partial [Stylophora pistillata]